jgi:hypothetical protein
LRQPAGGHPRLPVAGAAGLAAHVDGLARALADAVVAVVARDDVLLANLLGPPAQFGHPVLDGAHRQALSLPSLHQPFHVLGLQACCSHVPVAEFLKLACHQVEHALAIALRRIAAVAVAPAQLFQLVVQIPHSPSLVLILLSVSCPGVSALRCWCVQVR